MPTCIKRQACFQTHKKLKEIEQQKRAYRSYDSPKPSLGPSLGVFLRDGFTSQQADFLAKSLAAPKPPPLPAKIQLRREGVASRNASYRSDWLAVTRALKFL